MIIANPASGRGKSLKYLKEIVLPLLEEAGFRDIVVHVTKGRRHATKLALEIDPQTIGGILILSGDGTISEVMNGLYQHPKQKEALAIPVGVIPTGSGAGIYQLMCNPKAQINLFITYDDRDIVNATLRFCNWNPVPFKLLECESIDGKENLPKSISVIFTAFGLISEFIRLAEAMRWTRLGSFRYLLVSMYLRSKHYSYPCRISYILAGTDEWKTYENDFSHVNLWSQRHDPNAEKVNFTSNVAYMYYAKSGAKRPSLWEYPESEFILDYGCLPVTAFSLKYLNGKQHLSFDAEIPPYQVQECRGATYPLPATLLI